MLWKLYLGLMWNGMLQDVECLCNVCLRNVCGLEGLKCPMVHNGVVQCEIAVWCAFNFCVVWIKVCGMELCVAFRAFCSLLCSEKTQKHVGCRFRTRAQHSVSDFCIMQCSVAVMSVQLGSVLFMCQNSVYTVFSDSLQRRLSSTAFNAGSVQPIASVVS